MFRFPRETKKQFALLLNNDYSEVTIPESSKPSFEEIFSRYKERIYNFLLRLTRDKQDAEDLTSEAFLSVYKNYDKFRQESHVYTWIYRISLNLWRRHARKIGKNRHAGLDAPIHQDSDVLLIDVLPDAKAQGKHTPEEKLYRKETVAKAVENLPPKYREVIILSIVEEKSYTEISRVLRIPTNLVGIRLMRARQLLRIKLKDLKDSSA